MDKVKQLADELYNQKVLDGWKNVSMKTCLKRATDYYRMDEVVKKLTVMQSLPDWYKALSLLELQMKALQEDIPRCLLERRSDVTDLETLDMKLTAMRNRLHRAFEELKGNVA